MKSRNNFLDISTDFRNTGYMYLLKFTIHFNVKTIFNIFEFMPPFLVGK